MTGRAASVERALRAALGVVSVVVLSSAVAAMLRGLERPAGRVSGRPIIISRGGLVAGSVAFVATIAALWRPLPASDRAPMRTLGLVFGAPLLAAGLALYHGGRLAAD